MRVPDRILKAIQEELRQRPSKLGEAFMYEYRSELDKFERNIKDESRQDYMPYLMDRIAKRGERLQRWYDALIQDREETGRKKRGK